MSANGTTTGSSDIHAQRILILDFGSQFTQLITRKIRELNVFSEIKPFNVSMEEIKYLHFSNHSKCQTHAWMTK